MIEEIVGENGFYWVAGSYLLMVLLERVSYVILRPGAWDSNDANSNLMNTIINGVFDGLVGGFVFMGIYSFLYNNLAIWSIPANFFGWICIFLLNDLAYYSNHRLEHRTGLFWALHLPHHSSQHFNTTIAPRGTLIDQTGLGSPFYYLLPIVGVSPVMFIVVRFFANQWSVFSHSGIIGKMGFLEFLLMTPHNHSVHHGRQAIYLDKNYAQTLLIWDMLLGTYQKRTEDPDYGLVEQMDSTSIWDIQTWGVRKLFGKLQNARNLSDKFKCLVMPPEWISKGTEIIENSEGSS